MNIPRYFRPFFAVGVLAFSLACALTASPEPPTAPEDIPTDAEAGGAPVVALAAPVDGAVYDEGVAVNMLARVTNAGEDIDRVEITVDGEIVSTVAVPNPAGAPAFTVAQTWTAANPGPRTIGLTVFREDGSASDTVTRNIAVDGDVAVLISTDADTDTNAPGPVVTEEVEQTEEPTDTPEADSESDTDEAAAPTPQPEPTDEPTDTPPPASPTPNTPRGTTNTGVNVRAGPNTAFARIGSFSPGTDTTLLGVTSDRGWYKVEYYNSEGWIAASLLDVANAGNLPIDDGPPLPTPTPTQIPATAVPTNPPSNRNLTFDDVPQGFTPYPPDCGETMAITLRLRNTGSESLGTSTSAIVRDIHIDSGTTTETRVPVPDIGPGETVEVGGGFLTVDTNFGSRHRLEILLDPDSQITESNENDNTFSGGLEYTLDQGSNC